MSDSPPSEFLWLAVIGTITGFIYSFGIGANDVANSFASTISSKSLTLKQAVIVAGIFEFGGAIFLGASVTSTIRSKIFDINLYEDEPQIVMLGMATSLMTAAFMLLTATYFALPVSTTHTIVGCIMGFSIAAKGFDSIDWGVVKKIFISWVASPLVSGAIAFFFFGSLRIFVLRHEDAFKRSYYTFPLVLLIGIGIDIFYILYKGLKNVDFFSDVPVHVALPIGFAIGAGCGGIWLAFVGPFVKKRMEAGRAQVLSADEEKGERASSTASATLSERKDVLDPELVAKAEAKSVENKNEQDVNTVVDATVTKSPTHSEESVEESIDTPVAVEGEAGAKTKSSSMLMRAHQSFAENTYGQDLHAQSMGENAKASQLWDDAEMFDEDAEQLFTYVQVFTACLNSFAHGANDVSNAIAPISALIYIYQEGVINSKAPVQKWILAYGGAGIVLGLLLYGYKVMKSLGFKVTALSPSRGASAELASSLFVVTASFLEIPVSSTQCITGAVAGVGLASGVKNVHWLFLLRVCMGWVVIFFISVILSAGLFSFCAYSPSLV